MWANESVFYQIYPLGLCGAPYENDGAETFRLKRIYDFIPHIKKLGCNAVYFSPLFESDTHGYNTRDYRKVDVRLGSNEQFCDICKALHKEGIKVVLDGVFHHVGRGFFAFQDVLKNRENSRYCGWFYINFGGDSPYHDGLWYEGWEGNYDLVKLNLSNEEVVSYLFESIRFWISYFEIDGLRLDVAYCIDREFLRRLRRFCDEQKEDFFLLGEMIHGNYNDLVKPDMLHSATNYECYKGLYSSFNSMNLFEINHSLMRQFGLDGQGLYRGMPLLAFADNHDVTRIASCLNNEKHLPLLYAALFGMPGIPCIYYGSEWGAKGEKKDGDGALRASFEAPVENELTAFLSKLAEIRKSSKALCYGTFRSAFLTNRQCVMEREYEGERMLVAINADEHEFTAHFHVGCEKGTEQIQNEAISFEGGIFMEPYSAKIIKCE